jgi:hypothetical protein
MQTQREQLRRLALLGLMTEMERLNIELRDLRAMFDSLSTPADVPPPAPSAQRPPIRRHWTQDPANRHRVMQMLRKSVKARRLAAKH